MANFKHKVFLLIAKWIPVAVAAGILINNTLAMLDVTMWDVYVALNAQYHDNIELYKEWFGEDNIENIKDKIIESAIVNWFEDEDAGIEKVWNYFRAI